MQLGEAFRFEVGLEAGVELVECFVVRQAGHLQPGLVAAAVEHPDLVLEHQVEELAVAELRLLGAVDQLVGVLGDAVQLQLLALRRILALISSPIDQLLVDG